MKDRVLIKEIFESIQGEGLYVGVNQLFIRFSNCNLSCKYCDTDFKSNLKEYSVDELIKEVDKHKNIHSVSLTGGEPLLEIDFLLNFLPKINNIIYLETNGTLYKNLQEIIQYTDIISMDIKLHSCSNNKDLFLNHEEFIKIAKEKELFLKIVFDENITNEEIQKCCNLGKKYNLPIILQPKMDGEILKLNTQLIENIFYKFIKLYSNIRLIPQVHKFLY